MEKNYLLIETGACGCGVWSEIVDLRNLPADYRWAETGGGCIILGWHASVEDAKMQADTLHLKVKKVPTVTPAVPAEAGGSTDTCP